MRRKWVKTGNLFISGREGAAKRPSATNIYDTYEARPLRELSLSADAQHKPRRPSRLVFVLAKMQFLSFTISFAYWYLCILIVGGGWSEGVNSRNGCLMENMHFLIALGIAPASLIALFVSFYCALATNNIFFCLSANKLTDESEMEICIEYPLIIIFFSLLFMTLLFEAIFFFSMLKTLLGFLFCFAL